MAKAPGSRPYVRPDRSVTRHPGPSAGVLLERAAAAGSGQLPSNPRWREDLPWVGLALGLYALHDLLRVVPGLSYHQLAPAFFTDAPFFARFVGLPGGLLRYAAAAVSQLNFHGGLGAIAFAAVLGGVFLSTWRLLVRAKAAWPGLGAFVAATCLGMIPGRYTAGAELAATGLLAVTLAANVWDLGASRFNSLRYGGQWLMAGLVFYVAGPAATWGFCVTALLVDVGNGEPWRRVAIWATTPLLWLAWQHWHPALSVLAPFGDVESDSWTLVLTAASWLVTPLWIVGSGLAKWRRLRVSPPGRTGWVVACGLGVVLVWASLDRQRKAEAQVAFFSSRGEWERALQAARRVDQPSPSTSLHSARALFMTGRLLDELFSLPQQRGRGLLPGYEAGLDMSFPLAVTLLELGQVNLAEHLAHEAFELQGPRPEILHLLARVNLLLGRPEAAKVFLRRLRLVPFRRGEADVALNHVEALERGVKDEALEAIRERMPRTDDAQVQLPAEPLLQQLVDSNPANRMAVEYQLADALLERDLPTLAGRSALLAELASTPGRHCEEARLALQGLGKPEAGPGSSEKVGQATLLRYRAFLSAREQAERNGRRDYGALAGEFGDTYWYYLLTGRSVPRAQRSSPP